MTEEAIRRNERRRIELNLAINLLPEHTELFQRLSESIHSLPILPTDGEQAQDAGKC